MAINPIIIESPSDFFSEILVNITKARSRIIISALYVGCVKNLERNVLTALTEVISKRPEIELIIVVDYYRTLRPDGSFEKLRGLIDNLQAHKVKIALYKMPTLDGQRFVDIPILNEVSSVYHAKFLVFDETVILTGANMSDEYFAYRQDRYMKIESRSMATLLHSFASKLVDYSFTATSLEKNIGLIPPKIIRSNLEKHQLERNSIMSSLVANDGDCILKFKDLLKILSNNSMSEVSIPDQKCDDSPYRTIFCPIVQHSSLSIFNEEEYITELIKTFKWRNICISTPYPSFTSSFISALVEALFPPTSHMNSNLQNIRTTVSVLASSVSSHGFSGSTGFKSLVPYMHESLIWRTISSLSRALAEHEKNTTVQPPNTNVIFFQNNFGLSFNLLLYNRIPWTFHAKGIWLDHGTDASTYNDQDFCRKDYYCSCIADSESGCETAVQDVKFIANNHIHAPSDLSESYFITYIGSSNFGSRSWRRDFELGFIVATRDKMFTQRLKKEWKSLSGFNERHKINIYSPQSYTNSNFMKLLRKNDWRRVVGSLMSTVFRSFL